MQSLIQYRVIHCLTVARSPGDVGGVAREHGEISSWCYSDSYYYLVGGVEVLVGGGVTGSNHCY